MRLAGGLDIEVGGTPRQEIGAVEVPPVVGLLGSDYPGLVLRPLLPPGAAVAAGEPVLADPALPEIVVTAPVGGTIEEVILGPRRRLSVLALRQAGDAARTFETPPRAAPRESLQAFLRETGLWAALIARPFGRVPLPGSVPAAIFVAALDTEPNAVDPAPLVRAAAAEFARGLEFLGALTDGAVFLCQAPGPALAAAGGSLRLAEFAGAHPAGLPGTHLDRLGSPGLGQSPRQSVWQIGAQEVLALGAVLETGRLPGTRVVALGGPLARDPRLVRLPIGADIEALAAAEAGPGPRRVLSGSALSGGESRFLRRRHTQVTLLPRREPAPRRRGWLPAAPLKRPPLVPHAALDRALGPRLPAIPLLRALSVGDAAEAARLGAAQLIEEDLALATYLAGGTEDFAARLRETLDLLEGGT
jgi:Na+-transporting NADH:ubiquinone oxidoreductase subunit A